MNTSLKTLPGIAEILPGAFVIILLAYAYKIKHPYVLKSLADTGNHVLFITAGLAFLAFWIVGTSFDALRNVLENIWDIWWPINWDFFFKRKLTKVHQLEEFYYAYYNLDVNFVIGIISFFIAEAFAFYSYLPFGVPPLWIFVLTVIALVVFTWDAIIFRREIKKLIDKYEQSRSPS